MSYWKGEGGRGDVDEGKVLYTRLGNTAAHTYTIDVCMCDSVISTGNKNEKLRVFNRARIHVRCVYAGRCLVQGYYFIKKL